MSATPTEPPRPRAQSADTTSATPDFAALFREHAPFAWRCLRRLGVAEADADDVCQEVFLVVHKKLAELDPTRSARAWIYGICVRKASDHRRLAHKQRERPEAEAPDREAQGAGPDSSIDRRRALARLDRALDALDEPKRAAFVLYEIEGLSLQEVAAACDCPLQTVYSRLAAARQRLEQALAEGASS